MTIIVKRRPHLSQFRKEMRKVGEQARNISRAKLDSMGKFLIKKEKAENKLKAAAVRRYAKKNRLDFHYHRKPWVFVAKSGEMIDMPAGYFAIVKRDFGGVQAHGVLEKIEGE